MEYYRLKLKEVYSKLNSSEKGLSQKEAKERLKEGYNELKKKKQISPLKLFLLQFKGFLILILIAAAIIAAIIPFFEKNVSGLTINDFKDPIIITGILFLNALFGSIQEYKAEKAIEALKKLATPKAKVLRDNKEVEIPTKEIVPGDVLLLEEGDKIPADARIIKSINLEVQESALTGESMPIEKHTGEIKKKDLAERTNMLYSGTIITKGKANAIVVKTGMNTEIGKIASLIQKTKDEPTPLQKKLAHLGKILGIVVLVVSAVIFGIGILTGGNLLDRFILAVSLAIAAVPEGLPAVVTVSLAIAVQRMIKKNALIRKLPSVETLGSTTVICSDKTGTLTHNKMTVKKIFVNNEIIKISREGYNIKGEFSKKPKGLKLLLKIGALCNDSNLNLKNKKVIGDPTEAALIVSAFKGGIDKDKLEMKYPRIKEIPFSSERKMMTTMHNIKGEKTLYTKGAPDIVLKRCNRIYKNGKIRKLTKKDKEKILKTNKKLANEALRVLGFAYKKTNKPEEKNLVFVGLQAMIDPPRNDAIEAVKAAKKAGIRVIMITGDQELTAKAIAKQLNINGKSATGSEIEGKDLDKITKEVTIFSRIAPKQKVDIVSALKKSGNVVAMTGDGVNDAPALKKADIGIAVGSGTDVAKEASKMIITDDNFASIVKAIKEGRIIYDNIKKFVFYLLSSNMGEVLTIFTAILTAGIFGWISNGKIILPLLAVHVLWINLITDGLPALSLSVEPGEKDIMKRKPRKKNENILSKNMLLKIVFIGLIMAVGTLFIFNKYFPTEKAQTMAFTTLMMFQIFNVLNSRSHDKSIFKIGLFSNKYLWGAIFVSVLFQIPVIYTKIGNKLFSTVFLNLNDWLLIILVSSSVLISGELYKLTKRK